MEGQIRNQSIDLVKIVAMLGVMALHTCLGKTNELPAFILSRTFGLSMPLFFMVSGYLMQGRIVDWKYSVRKVWGIVRFTLIICFVYFFIHTIRHGYEHLLFVKTWLGAFVESGQFPIFWYFGAMIFLYLLLPLYNKIEQKMSFFYPKVIGILLGMVFCFFMADYINNLELNNFPQTFRLWYWLLFFTFGQMLRRYNRGGQKMRLSIVYVLPFQITMLVFVWYSKNHMPSMPLFFGSNLLILYALSTFVYISQKEIKDSGLIRELSKCFLPCYAFHNFVIAFVQKIDIAHCLGNMSVYIDYILVVTITLVLSWSLMKIPYMDRVFRI